MSKKTGPLVFDAYPFLVLLRKQNGWERVRDLVDEATNSDFVHVVSLINLGEAYYQMLRDFGEKLAKEFLEGVQNSAFEIVNPTYSQMLQASRFKAQGGLSYADCYAAALAIERGIPVLTGDREFSVVERQGVTIEWLPMNR
ncbi:MAG TPA: type II toxin-antitoxin system VapC family toxin [Candidatus Kapabacteria bacterium]|nr:type II toxin-antitoxin system VapC family toxin [Candidatus Kapabacteria bacterium]